MKASEARKLTEQSEAAYNKAKEEAFREITEACNKGKFECWVTLPKGDGLETRFIEDFSLLEYTIGRHSTRQGNRIHITW